MFPPLRNSQEKSSTPLSYLTVDEEKLKKSLQSFVLKQTEVLALGLQKYTPVMKRDVLK